MSRTAVILTLTLLIGSLSADSSHTQAEPLWQRLISGSRVEADPNKDYYMTKENGPWMIMATTFSGDGAIHQARELVVELRSRYKIPAYLHKMDFDYSGTVKGKGIDETGQPLRMRYKRSTTVSEIAVLVGNYSSVSDSDAQRTLKKIKKMSPEALNVKNGESTHQTLAKWRMFFQVKEGEHNFKNKTKGPMAKAFITRNPMIPDEYFVPKGIDKFVEKINSDVKYSLLQCKGKYTVKVASFRGNTFMDQKEIENLNKGKQMKSRLVEAGEKAESLAYALRKKGWDAYVFHDRMMSMVTIGSFDSVGTPRQDGKIEINPRINVIMNKFRADKRDPNEIKIDNPTALTAYAPKTLINIPLDIQPEIVYVPRRSISSDYR